MKYHTCFVWSARQWYMYIHTLSVLSCTCTHTSIQYILVLNTVSEQQSAAVDTVFRSLVSMLRRRMLRLSLSHQYSIFRLVWSRDSPDTLEVVSFSRTFRSAPSKEACSIVILPLSTHIMVLKYIIIQISFYSASKYMYIFMSNFKRKSLTASYRYFTVLNIWETTISFGHIIQHLNQ